jgi:hypothetical protein
MMYFHHVTKYTKNLSVQLIKILKGLQQRAVINAVLTSVTSSNKAYHSTQTLEQTQPFQRLNESDQLKEHII